MQGVNIDSQDAEEYGDIISDHGMFTVRIGLQNVNRLPISGRDSKSIDFLEFLKQHQFDLYMMTETGLDWRTIRPHNRWAERTHSRLHGSRHSLGFNTTEPPTKTPVQFGGTGVIVTQELAHRTLDYGQDPTGLGRWSWLRLQGKQNHFLRVISVYRPVESQGVDTVWTQHQRYFEKQDKTRNPREAIYHDLGLLLQEWIEAGDHVVLGIDANEDIRKGETHTFFSSLGMREAVLHSHSNSPPATCDKNKRREPIDGMFVTPSITPLAAGYMPFGAGCRSDHRVLWMDLSFQTCLGFSQPPLAVRSPRRLKSQDPRLTRRYCTKVTALYKKYSISQRLQNLEETAGRSGWNSSLENKYNKIDQAQLAIRRSAESELRRLRMGGVPWSPALQTIRDRIEYWSLLHKKRLGRKVSTTHLRRLKRKAECTQDSFQFSTEEVKQHLDQAYTDYNKAKKVASNWRDDFLPTLAHSRATHLDLDEEQELKRLRQVHKQRTQARKIKQMRHRLVKNPTTQVYSSHTGARQLYQQKESIEEACMVENERRFTQTHSSTPMQHPLLQEMGLLGDTPQAETVLQGTYQPPPDTDQYMVKFLCELSTPISIQHSEDLPHHLVTFQDNFQAWKKQRENTAAEPTSLHFGHFKSTCSNTILGTADTILRSLPYQYGFSPASWQKITDVEILKKPGVYDIEKMRTITLMHSLFNANNKKLGRDTLRHAEIHGTIAREQYGSRKHHQASTAALNKVLTMDLLRLSRRSGAICSNDAKSCYDRIVHWPAALAMRRLGAPRAAVHSSLLTIQRAHHYISTAFGVSSQHYGPNPLPLQGLGQGNGWAPTGWAVLSTPVIHMLLKQGLGFQFVAALSLIGFVFVCYAFVDDTDVAHCSADNETPGEEVLSDMQDVVDHWEGGLRATGGAINASKSLWYLIDFKWIHDRWEYRTQSDLPGDLLIRNYDGTRVTLTRREPHEATKTLGIYMAMDGSQESEYQYLLSKAQEFADHIRTGHVSRTDAWIALRSTILRTLEYPMVATSLTKKQWDKIMSPILRHTLPKAGFASTFPRVLVFSPNQYLGLGITHPYFRQHLLQLEACLHHTQTQSITNDLLRADLEQLRLESGICRTSFMSLFSRCHAYLTPTWYTRLFHFCAENQLALYDDCHDIQCRTTHDRYLMEDFISSGYRGKNLCILNTCRQKLQAITLSDLTDATLKTFADWAFNGSRQVFNRSHLQWPRTPSKVPPHYWRLWSEALKKCFSHHTTPRKLRVDLGTWLIDAFPIWNWYIHPPTDRIYWKRNSTWHEGFRIPRRSRRERYRLYPRTVSTVPTNLCPITVAITPGKPFDSPVTLTGQVSFPPESCQIGPLSFFEYTSQLPQSHRWAIHELDSPDHGYTLAMGLQNGTATAISDGSTKNRFSTSAFVLRGTPTDIPTIGTNAVPGRPEDQDSYRAEIGGISGILVLLQATCTYHSIISGSIKIHLDGHSALLACQAVGPVSPTDKCYDLISFCRAQIRKLPLTIQWEWVRGHQDDKSPATLSYAARDNILCDKLAKRYWKHCDRHSVRAPPLRIQAGGWQLLHQDIPLSHIEHNNLYQVLYSSQPLNYWSKRMQVPIPDLVYLDWEASGSALRAMNYPEQRRLIKHASGWAAVGTRLEKMGLQSHSRCPFCEQPETTEHLIQCPDARVTAIWEASLCKLSQWFEKTQTSPTISEIILSRLRSWRNNQPPSNVYSTSMAQDATASQDRFGWYSLLTGRISMAWRLAQQQYLDTLGYPNTGKRWASQLILQLARISWDMWDHRNGFRHSSCSAEYTRIRSTLQTEINRQVILGTSQILPQDHHWLSPTVLSSLSLMPNDHLQKWLDSLIAARRRYQRGNILFRDSDEQLRTSMAQWLRQSHSEN